MKTLLFAVALSTLPQAWAQTGKDNALPVITVSVRVDDLELAGVNATLRSRMLHEMRKVCGRLGDAAMYPGGYGRKQYYDCVAGLRLEENQNPAVVATFGSALQLMY